ncbi:pro-opiomelanocortin-like [Aulostomus maculatus]
MCPVWLLVAGVVVGVAKGSVTQCWEHPSCQEVNSESSIMECIQLCRTDLTAERPLVPGASHLQPPPPLGPESLPPLLLLPSSSPSSSSQAKRSYSMEHFRWGKPVMRKRRPIRVYTSNSIGEGSSEVFPGEMRRRELSGEVIAAEEEKTQGVSEEEQDDLSDGVHEMKDGTYKMTHFRWSSPSASKRYGGFMRGWVEHSQRPLLTLFKNVINKDGQQQK